MKKDFPQLVVSDKKGNIFNIPHIEAIGMKAGYFFCLKKEEFIKLPSGSRLFMLPERLGVGYDPATGDLKVFKDYLSVAAFISPGFTVSYSPSYRETNNPRELPLFCYSSCAFYKGGFYVTAVRIDTELRHDPRFIDINLVKKNVAKLKKAFQHNRLIKHLGDCALVYGCPGAQNFFLSRYEAPLPVSPFCNARCPGCISYQPKGKFPPTQPRIKFIPYPEEVKEAALYHIDNVKDPVVSFGQGCEGEPLLMHKLIERSIRLIRKNTLKGIININTNGSLPGIVARLFDAGLDSIRVSLNSVRKEYYERYYKPIGYGFNDVARSIKMAKKKKGYVSINYLTMPGFTDSEDEFRAFRRFIEAYHIDMIQWRNLNFDPLRYFNIIKMPKGDFKMLGIREIIGYLKKDFPNLMMGYYNPSRLKMNRQGTV